MFVQFCYINCSGPVFFLDTGLHSRNYIVRSFDDFHCVIIKIEMIPSKVYIIL